MLNAKIELVKQFGSDDDTKNMLGTISSFTVDRTGNLFVADDALKVIKVFSKDGMLIRVLGHGVGKGPGEFGALGSIDVDSLSNVYVLDKVNTNLTVIDSFNNVLGTLKLKFLPSQVAVVRSGVADVMGFPFSYKGDLIHRLTIIGAEGNNPILTYCKRLTIKEATLIERSGQSGRLVRSTSGKIYYAFPYPYEIRQFSQDGELLKTFVRQSSFLAPPYFEYTRKTTVSPSGISGLMILPDEIVVTVLYNSTNDTIEYRLEFFDGKNGEYIGTVPAKQLGLSSIRYIRSDSEGYLYLDQSEPYPHINKYKLIVDLNE
ncbi:MAG: 6-bladed beta-propeller [Nitrososphaera sp.]|jgi:hypothetical protein